MSGISPETLSRALETFLEATRQAFGPGLRSAILFGSAAEGRLRPRSDVNLILVLRRFDRAAAGAIEGPLNVARAAIGLRVMLLLESEIAAASVAFAQKFADILRRHRVLYGDDVFAGLQVPRAALIARERQVVLNLAMRLRERYVLAARRDDQVARALTDVVGPLRVSAADVLELESKPAPSPREALRLLIESCGRPEWNYLPDYFSRLREGSVPPPGTLAAAVFHTLELLETLRGRVESL